MSCLINYLMNFLNCLERLIASEHFELVKLFTILSGPGANELVLTDDFITSDFELTLAHFTLHLKSLDKAPNYQLPYTKFQAVRRRNGFQRFFPTRKNFYQCLNRSLTNISMTQFQPIDGS